MTFQITIPFFVLALFFQSSNIHASPAEECIFEGGPQNNICYLTNVSNNFNEHNINYEVISEKLIATNKAFINVSLMETKKKSSYGLQRAAPYIEKTWQGIIRDKLFDKESNSLIHSLTLKNFLAIKEIDPIEKFNLTDLGLLRNYINGEVFRIKVNLDKNKFQISFSDSYLSKIWNDISPINNQEIQLPLRIGLNEHLSLLKNEKQYKDFKEKAELNVHRELINSAGGSQVAGGQQAAGGSQVAANPETGKPWTFAQSFDALIEESSKHSSLRRLSIESLYSKKNELKDFLNFYLENKFLFSDIIKVASNAFPENLQLVFPNASINSDNQTFKELSHNPQLKYLFEESLKIFKKTQEKRKVRELQKSRLRNLFSQHPQRVYLVDTFPSINKSPRIDGGIGNLYLTKVDMAKLQREGLYKYLMLHEAEHLKLMLDNFIKGAVDLELNEIIKAVPDFCNNRNCSEEKDAFKKSKRLIERTIDNYFIFTEANIDLSNIDELNHKEAIGYNKMLSTLLPKREATRINLSKDFTSIKADLSKIGLSPRDLNIALQLLNIDLKIREANYSPYDQKATDIEFLEGITHIISRFKSSNNIFFKRNFNMLNKTFNLKKWNTDYNNFLIVKRIFENHKP